MKQIYPETGICFFRIQHKIPLIEFLLCAEFSPLPVASSQPLIEEWLDYGCVYVNGKRQRQDLMLEPDQIIRLHTRRKRYWQSQGTLKEHIVEDNEEFLVLDKPGGLPTHPTLDNFRDNAKVLLEEELKTTLYTTHRLDIPTQGLLIIAKTPDAQRLLNKMFSLSRVNKIYRSINQAPVRLGLHTHFMNPESRVPKQVQLDEVPDWYRCQMEVLRAGKATDGYWHEMKLLTGKTH